MKLQANIENLKFDDKKYIKREFELGDIVLVRKSIRNKNDGRFEGPGEIIDKVHDRRYTIRFENGRTLLRNIEWQDSKCLRKIVLEMCVENFCRIAKKIKFDEDITEINLEIFNFEIIYLSNCNTAPELVFIIDR